MRDQPEHDRLSPGANAAVDRFLAARRAGDQVDRAAAWNPIVWLALIMFLAALVAVVLVVRAQPEAPAGPGVVVVTPSPYGQPAPTGGPR